jgi:HNH endonuclease
MRRARTRRRRCPRLPQSLAERRLTSRRCRRFGRWASACLRARTGGMGMMSIRSPDEFWHAARVNAVGCWIWQGRTHRGYGYVYWGGRQWRVHRLAYVMTNGPIAPGLCICHACDERACVNPDHLWLGTQADNRRDCVDKDRQARGIRHGAYTQPGSRRRGTRNGRARLIPSDIAAIRARYQPFNRTGGPTTIGLAREFGISQSQCWRIVNQQSWRH